MSTLAKGSQIMSRSERTRNASQKSTAQAAASEVSAAEPLKTIADNRSMPSAQRKLQEYSVAQLKSASHVIQKNPGDAPSIAGGHAFSKHVEQQKEWGDPPSVDRAGFEAVVSSVMNSPDERRDLSNGRRAYWKGDTVVIWNPSAGDKGTCFKPKSGKSYFENLT